MHEVVGAVELIILYPHWLASGLRQARQGRHRALSGQCLGQLLTSLLLLGAFR